MNKPDAGPLVSVIIPTFNRGWIVAEAIQSVLAQTYRQFELIVVDDGSTDRTASILHEFQDHIRIIRQTNQGVSAARNQGVDAAQGAFVAFLDSDDLWKPEKLAVQVNFFLSNSEALICQTDEIWIRNGRRINPKIYHQKPSGDIFLPSLALCLVSPSAVMLKKDFFQQVGGFDESLPACEDYDLWLRISCRHPVFLIPDQLVVKRGGHADQLSKNPGLDRYRIVSLLNLLKTQPLSPLQRQATVAMLVKKTKIYTGGCIKHGRQEEAAQIKRLVEEEVAGWFD